MDGAAVDDFTDVEAITEELGEGADAEPDAAAGFAGRKDLATRANSFAVQVLRQVTDRSELKIAPENRPDCFSFLGHD